jgi:hypothetical protein
MLPDSSAMVNTSLSWVSPREASPMPEIHSPPRVVRFGAFEADLDTGELRKDGVKLKFSGQPFHVLAMLLERYCSSITGYY